MLPRIFKKFSILSVSLKFLVWLLLIGGTVSVALSLAWNVGQIKQRFLEVVRTQAVMALEKDILAWHWNAIHGGVYAPITKDTPPNPYLADFPERDITTPSGERLTLINPASMMGQIYEIEQKEKYSFLGHVTSLNPIRPQNAPDPWERKALKEFERGKPEISALEVIAGKEYFRLMRPLRVEPGCLKCHAVQGYNKGEIRGGISVSILTDPLFSIMRKRIYTFTMSHGILLLIGLVGLLVITHLLIKSETERKQTEKEIHNLSITDALTGLLNRRGFITLAEQQIKIARRTCREMVLLFMDLDRLKFINDTFGHARGDQALREIAAILKNTFRKSDIIARLGGDEFVVLAVETPENKSSILRKRLQEKVDAYNAKENKVFNLSFSSGTVLFDPRFPVDIEELLVQADATMYEEKKGKNFSA